MVNSEKFYIDGSWVDPVQPKTLDVVNPATEKPVAKVSLGSAADVEGRPCRFPGLFTHDEGRADRPATADHRFVQGAVR